MTANRSWDVQQEHTDSTLYARYHKDVWMPQWVLEAAKKFLPDKGEVLPLSKHYKEVASKQRNLPSSLYMPYRYDIVDVTVVRNAGAIYRVLIRAPFNKLIDIGLVLEGDFEVVTAYWHSPNDQHETLEVSVYEPDPIAVWMAEYDAEGDMLAAEEEEARRQSEGLEEMRRQSRPDDQT